jgi:hypothetical protein
MLVSSPGRIFLLSPAKVGGPRYSMLTREKADFDLARKLREGAATIGAVCSLSVGYILIRTGITRDGIVRPICSTEPARCAKGLL